MTSLCLFTSAFCWFCSGIACADQDLSSVVGFALGGFLAFALALLADESGAEDKKPQASRPSAASSAASVSSVVKQEGGAA